MKSHIVSWQKPTQNHPFAFLAISLHKYSSYPKAVQLVTVSKLTVLFRCHFQYSWCSSRYWLAPLVVSIIYRNSYTSYPTFKWNKFLHKMICLNLNCSEDICLLFSLSIFVTPSRFWIRFYLFGVCLHFSCACILFSLRNFTIPFTKLMLIITFPSFMQVLFVRLFWFYDQVCFCALYFSNHLCL